MLRFAYTRRQAVNASRAVLVVSEAWAAAVAANSASIDEIMAIPIQLLENADDDTGCGKRKAPFSIDGKSARSDRPATPDRWCAGGSSRPLRRCGETASGRLRFVVQNGEAAGSQAGENCGDGATP